MAEGYMNRHWTSDELQEAFNMRMDGKSVSEIAKHQNRTYKSVHCKLSREYGVDVFKKKDEKVVDTE